MARKRGMGGPDMPRPGTPAAMAMENDRTGVVGQPYDGAPVAGAPPRRSAPISIAPPRRRPTSGVIPPASLPAEPPPLRGPGQRMGGPDPLPMTVLQRAQRYRALPSTPDHADVGAQALAAFRMNYRRTHKAELTPAQEALMARYLYDQNPNGALFQNPRAV